MPYLLHDAVYLVAIFPSQRTSLDSDISVSREVLVVTTVIQGLAVVRVWWDDVSWDGAIRDFAVICGWIQTCSDKQVRLSSLVTLEFYAANAYCLSCYRTLLERLNTQTHMLIYYTLFLSHNQILWEISLTYKHNGQYVKCGEDGETMAQNIPTNMPFWSAIIPVT